MYIINWWKIWFLNLIIGLHDKARLKREDGIVVKSMALAKISQMIHFC